MKALLDGDICLYRVGYTTEKETEDIAIIRMDELLHRILDTVQASSFVVYLSCGRTESFRAKLNPDYKAHRTREKPLHYDLLKQHLLDNWKAVVAVEEEADDRIGIDQTADPENTVGCTIDKDILYGVVGNKYNFVKEEMFYTSPEEAVLFFYKQLLMGDKADNIIGLDGIGPAKAGKALNELLGEPEQVLFDKVKSMYVDAFQDLSSEEIDNILLLSGRQLKIRTYEGELWELPGQKAD